MLATWRPYGCADSSRSSREAARSTRSTGDTVTDVLERLEEHVRRARGLDPRRARRAAAPHQRLRQRRAGRARLAGRGRRQDRDPARHLGRLDAPAMTELLVGTRKGLFVLDGDGDEPFAITTRAFVGDPVDYAMREPATGRRVRRGHVAVLGPADLVHRRPRRAASGRRRTGVAPAARRRRGAQAHLGDRRQRRRLAAVGRRRPRRAVREPRRRRELGAQPRALRAPDAAALEAGLGRPVGALDRAVAGRPATASRSRSPPPASGSPTTAARPGATATRGSSPTTCPSRRAAPRSTSACTTSSARPRAPERLFMQFHGGVYRSDDAGESWIDIADGPAVGLRLPGRRRPRPIPTARTSSRSRRPTASRPAARCSSGRRATRARRGPRTATGLPQQRRLPADPPPVLRSRRRGRRARALLRRDVAARSSARATRAGRGSASRAGCRRSRRCGSAGLTARDAHAAAGTCRRRGGRAAG